jgi:glutaredoxin
MLFALSTCGWCKRAKAFLDENHVPYDHLDVDLLQGTEREEALARVRRWNPRLSFPTIVVDDQTAVVGFDEARLREVLSP